MSALPEDVTDGMADSVTFAVPESRKSFGLRIFAFLAGAQILLLLGIGLVSGRFPWEAALVLAIVLPMALGIVLWLNRHVYDPATLKIVIGRQGIYAPRMAAALIPWSAIEAMAIQPYYWGPVFTGLVLRLKVSDAGRFGPRNTNFVKRLSHWRFGGDLLFPVSRLDRPADEVADAIERFAPSGLRMSKRRGV